MDSSERARLLAQRLSSKVHDGEDIRWILTLIPITAFPGQQLIGPWCCASTLLRPDGRLHDGLWYPRCAWKSLEEKAKEFLGPDGLFWLTGPVLEALRLMHCKNIGTRDHTFRHRDEKRLRSRLGRSRAAQGYVFKTFTFTVPRKKGQLRDEVRDLVPGQRAAHEVIGHFATYTPDRPMFGRLSGTFYIPPHRRGNSGIGFVDKLYTPVGEKQK